MVAVLAPSLALAAALDAALGWDAVRSAAASAAVLHLLVRVVPAALFLRGPGDRISGCEPVVAVSGRRVDVLYALHSASFLSAVFATSAVFPAAAVLVPLDLLPSVLPGRYRQTLGDRVAGVQVVVRSAAEEGVPL